MRVLFVTSEAYPLAKSGGLADVSSALPIALMQQGVDVRILMPGYAGALAGLKNPRIEARLEPLLGVEDAALVSGQLPDSLVPVWLVDAPSLYVRDGGLYQNGDGRDWPDNARRFAFLAHVAAGLAGGIADWKPDVVHANDWHAGLLPLLLSEAEHPRPATVFTIHNLAYQGNFAPDVLSEIGIDRRHFDSGGIEFYGQVSFLKAGIRYSDKVTTVSPTYAKEVLTPDYGCGMDGVLQTRVKDFSGILNGIDNESWNPATDPHLAQAYSVRDIAGKRICKADLQRAFGLEARPDAPLIGFVSRITHQKMADVLLDAVPAMVAAGAQFVAVGEGEPALESAFREIGRRYEGSVGIRIGYEEGAAHRLQAGCDILLAPARFEPCGLTQIYASRYGTVPIVRRTGGLADTVVDATGVALVDRTATGFRFEEPSLSALLGAIARALALYKEPLAWRRLQLQGMAQDFGWHESAAKYIALYHDTTGIPAGDRPGVSLTDAELRKQAAR